MKYIYYCIAILIIGTALISCGDNANYKHLTAQGWTLDEIVYADSTYTITPPAEMTIIFSDSSTISGHGGCNSFFGVYTPEGQKTINIEVKGSTMAWCENLEFEERYFSILNLADSYEADRDRLTINNSQNRVRLVFRPIFTL